MRVAEENAKRDRELAKLMERIRKGEVGDEELEALVKKDNEGEGEVKEEVKKLVTVVSAQSFFPSLANLARVDNNL
jgi:hypothetical protein